jgi:predicted 2-oxoglutarate/Fe(II)-dependent dioxygenase YbiX
MRHIIENFLTPEECASLIDRAESAGMEPATITTPSGAKLDKSYRNNDRLIFDDEELASKLWAKIQNHVVISDETWKPSGLNERFKIYRYCPGQNFAMHTDASFIRNDNERSFQTLIVYLNEEYEGGETEFFGLETVKPKTGMATLFLHHLMHEGLPVESGVKYALRTDVMYER